MSIDTNPALVASARLSGPEIPTCARYQRDRGALRSRDEIGKSRTKIGGSTECMLGGVILIIGNIYVLLAWRLLFWVYHSILFSGRVLLSIKTDVGMAH